MRPLATKLTANMSCSERNAPDTRNDSFSSPVCSTPAGLTMFCACNAVSSAVRSIPSVASSCMENST